ncbi:hypothetical protein AKJ56_00880 [candidate division MSBL1 archaeon SCGC-AAA382N08]|uniref:Methyltransferase domain-containing protein n=1 Tax=candidate division MSBL1 archaeon SCGC-AAA382N08 TaxID=1698285 RepID=A0A133VQ70_9EURY|nr:hypothetical protein AKJ56_00880 [candidate division MSBL1 archaeon SCGC-AAA382N08]
MSKTRKEKWEKKYRKGNHHTEEEPSPLLLQWLESLPSGKALDVGCGAGRNSLFLADQGYEVDAIDFSEEAIKRGKSRAQDLGLEINWIQADVNKYEFPSEKYDLIIVTFFHPRGMLSEIKKSLKNDGFFLYEHHLSVEDEIVRGPKSDKFRYEPNELLKLFSDFQVLYYREGILGRETDEKSAIVKMVARKAFNFRKSLPNFTEH